MPGKHPSGIFAGPFWEVLPSGVEGSIALTMGEPPGTGGIVKIPVRATWGTGPIQLRIWARDYAGLVSIPYMSEPGAVRIFPASATAVQSTASAPLGGTENDAGLRRASPTGIQTPRFNKPFELRGASRYGLRIWWHEE